MIHVFALGSYDIACECRDTRKEFLAKYNARRMYETPLLNIGSDDDDGQIASAGPTSATIEEDSPENLQPNEDAGDDGESVRAENALDNSQSSDGDPNNPALPLPIEEVIVENNMLVTVKFEGEAQQLQLFELGDDVLGEIEAIFDNNDPIESNSDESDDDIIFIDDGKPLPRPVNFTLEMLVKRNDDPISGSLAFSEMVSTVSQHCNSFGFCIVSIE